MNNSLTNFCSYIQPILNSCLGYIKSDGFFTHIPGYILAMSADETTFAVINIPVIYEIYVTAYIPRFMQLKTPEEQENLFNEVYFTGWNMKRDSLIQYNQKYGATMSVAPIYEEPNVFNIPNFDQISKQTSIGNVTIFGDNKCYLIPASKSITPISKSDSCSLRLYNCMLNHIDQNQYSNIKTLRYTLFKKKFKLNVDIYMNILVI